MTYLAGQAAQRAAMALRDLVTGEAARHFSSPVASITITDGALRRPRRGKISFADLAARASSAGKLLTARSNFKIEERTGSCLFFCPGGRGED